MSWNTHNNKNKEQPKRRGVKGKSINYFTKKISIKY